MNENLGAGVDLGVEHVFISFIAIWGDPDGRDMDLKDLAHGKGIIIIAFSLILPTAGWSPYCLFDLCIKKNYRSSTAIFIDIKRAVEIF